MRWRLDPIPIMDLSAGLNKSGKSLSLLNSNEMSESENVTYLGRGRLGRRHGMKRFATAGVIPTEPSATEEAGRLLFPYIRRITQTENKRTIVESLSLIKNLLYRCVDGSSPINVYLKGNALVKTMIGWKPYSSLDTSRQHEDQPNIAAAFLDDRVYLGTKLTDKDWEDSAGDAIVGANYPYGCLLFYTTSSVFAGQENFTITGATSGATGKIGYINNSYKALFLYDWNGKEFTDGETISTDAVPSKSDTLVRSAEYGHQGVILDHGTAPTSNFQARKWGIEEPHTVIGSIEGDAGAIEAGTYRMRYTFIRYEGGSMSAGDNPKLSGGKLISESAPATYWEVVLAADKKLSHTGWEVSPDPQVTHVRIYRDDGISRGTWYHAADVAVGGSAINDNLDFTALQLTGIITYLTDDYKPFGYQGEYSGDIIEVGDHRVTVAGNKDYPYRLYLSRARIDHQHSEYFYSSLDFGEAPGESITAIKWWNEVFWVFTERSLYKVVDVDIEIDIVTGKQIVTHGIGCASRRGVLDMGDHLIVLTQLGLQRFNGSMFMDNIPLTENVRDIVGTDLLNAILTKDDNYIYISTTTSRASDLIVKIKYRDGSYACGTDKINTAIGVPERFAFVPPLTNFANTIDDSDYMLALFRNADDGGNVRYWIGKYNMSGENKDLLFTTEADTEYAIIAKFAPRVFDFGAFVEATLEKMIAFIAKCGEDTATKKLPTGEFLVKIYVNPTDNAKAKLYTEIKLRPVFDRTISTDRTDGDPIQPKYKKAFSATYPHQTGGVFSTKENPAALLADYQEILYRGGSDHMINGRFWKMIFQYESEANFEFTNAAFRFVAEEGTL